MIDAAYNAGHSDATRAGITNVGVCRKAKLGRFLTASLMVKQLPFEKGNKMDPIEQMQYRIERLIDEWDEAQAGVPSGSYRCPYCKEIFDYSPVSADPTGDGPAGCWSCIFGDVEVPGDAENPSGDISIDPKELGV